MPFLVSFAVTFKKKVSTAPRLFFCCSVSIYLCKGLNIFCGCKKGLISAVGVFLYFLCSTIYNICLEFLQGVFLGGFCSALRFSECGLLTPISFLVVT